MRRLLLLLLLLLQLSACSHRVNGVMTSYKHSIKTTDDFRRDEYECSTMVRTMLAAERASFLAANTNSPEVVLVTDMLQLTTSPYGDNSGYEHFRCLLSRGWSPRIQFVNTDYLKASGSFETEFDSCKKQMIHPELVHKAATDASFLEKVLEDDDSIDIVLREEMDTFATCLTTKGWMLVTRPPWYVNGQKLDSFIRFIPRGNWTAISRNDDFTFFYDPLKVVAYGNMQRIKVLKTYNDPANPKTSVFTIELDCSGRKYRVSNTRRIEQVLWLAIPDRSHADVWHNKVCQ